MRLSGVSRFIILGAVGFGVGSAIFDAVPILSFFATGAFGGAALGLALKDRRKTITLALTGLAGFGVGFVVWFFILYSFVPDFGSFHVGVVGGAIGGAALGLSLRRWKSIVALAFAAGVGFGLGGLIFDIFSQPLVEPGASGITFWWAVLFMAVQGILGGASLGTALGILEARRLDGGSR